VVKRSRGSLHSMFSSRYLPTCAQQQHKGASTLQKHKEIHHPPMEGRFSRRPCRVGAQQRTMARRCGGAASAVAGANLVVQALAAHLELARRLGLPRLPARARHQPPHGDAGALTGKKHSVGLITSQQ
jgi:hypothetical protein